MNFLRLLVLGLFFAGHFTTRASLVVPLTTPDHVTLADAIFRGTVVGSVAFKDANGLIHTRTSLQVNETFKGIFPEIVALVHRGGTVGNEDEFCGLSPKFTMGDEYLLFISRMPDGTLHCSQGGASAIRIETSGAGGQASRGTDASTAALLEEIRTLAGSGLAGEDVTDQTGEFGVLNALTGMLGGIASRFLAPDRGEGIRYLIDADSLPAGITLAQATNAVLQAMNAWTAVTSLKFTFEGIQSFGQGADTLSGLGDDRLRIQLHDNYNRISTATTLGIGGRTASSSPLPGVGWDIGGNIAGNEFRKTIHGYVVLEITNATMQNLTTFTEVLCHEIGHALNLAHSSEIVTGDPVLFNSIMYFQVHADGRGAALGSYDPPIIQQIYPFNSAPFAFNRVIDVITAAAPPNVPGINQAGFGYDLQSVNLTLLVTNVVEINGAFSVDGTLVSFTPDAFYATSPRLDPAGTSAYDRLYVRVSDGTNGSPYVSLRTISFNEDDDFPSDGIPNDWMITYFGHSNPLAGDKSRATDDADDDGLNNLQEYRAGMSPTSAASAQRVTLLNPGFVQWQAMPYEAYEIETSSNLLQWTRASAILATNNPASVSLPVNPFPGGTYFRIRKSP